MRPGESLREITKNYLGSEALWERNWRLNPELEDPHVLVPGQRLLVLIAPDESVPSAQLVTISGRVDGRPAPIDWNPSVRQDLMLESDGIRTGNQSSTALKFHDGTEMVLTEESIIFFKKTGRSLAGIEQNSVEIVEGQADLARVASDVPQANIEIIIGDTRATPKAGPTGTAQARLRKSDAGAQLMVYEGESDVEAAGRTMAVPTGMGTSVPEGGPPTPPEKLLPASGLAAPASGGSLETGFLDFTWSAIEGAASYTVEVCQDSACQALVRREVGISGVAWTASTLPLGDFFWRVTATAASGLDGYPSDSRPVAIKAERAEYDPPTGAIQLTGLSAVRAGRTFWGPDADVVVITEDVGSGVASWTASVDGGATDAAELDRVWATGKHSIKVDAEDNLRNRGQLAPLEFVVDAEPPKIVWRLGGREIADGFRGERGVLAVDRWWSRKAARYNRRQAKRRNKPAWTVLGWGNERVDVATTTFEKRFVEGVFRKYRAVRVTGESPMVVLLTPAASALKGDGSGDYLGGDYLEITAKDDMAGVEDLVVRTSGSRGSGYRLVAEAKDRLGNRRRAEWRLGVE